VPVQISISTLDLSALWEKTKKGGIMHAKRSNFFIMTVRIWYTTNIKKYSMDLKKLYPPVKLTNPSRNVYILTIFT